MLLLWLSLAPFVARAGQTSSAPASPGVTVSGTVVTTDQTPLQHGAALMTLVSGDPPASRDAADVEFRPDGAFSFRHVAPGLYQIRARAQTARAAVTLFAGYRVEVRERDVTGLRLVLRPGALVSGTVEVAAEEDGRPSFEGVRVRAPFVDGSSFADALTGVIRKDGTFRIAGVMEGDHYVALEGLREPWVLRHALWRGADVSDAPFSAESGARVEGIRLVVSTRATELAGIVRDEAGAAAMHANVYISPSAADSWRGGSRRFVVLRTDASGRYRHRGLPPGEYRVSVAFDSGDAPNMMRVRARAGQTVSLADGESRRLDLVVPASATRASAAVR